MVKIMNKPNINIESDNIKKLNINISANKITFDNTNYSIKADDIIKEFSLEEFKSKVKFGNTCYMLTKKFNKFQKFMLKICFGIEVEDI